MERLVVVPIARIGGRGRTLEACVAVVAAVLLARAPESQLYWFVSQSVRHLKVRYHLLGRM